MQELATNKRDISALVLGLLVVPLIVLIEGIVEDHSATVVALSVLGGLVLGVFFFAGLRWLFRPNPRPLPAERLIKRLSDWLYAQNVHVGKVALPITEHAFSATETGAGARTLFIGVYPDRPAIFIATGRMATDDEQSFLSGCRPANNKSYCTICV